MRIVAFILESDAIDAILAHLRKLGRDPSALPEHAPSQAGRPPPLDVAEFEPDPDALDCGPDLDLGSDSDQPDLEPDSDCSVEADWE